MRAHALGPLFFALALALVACPRPLPAPAAGAPPGPLSTTSPAQASARPMASAAPPAAPERMPAAPSPAAPVAPSAEPATPPPSASSTPLFTRDQRIALYGACAHDDDCVVTNFGSCCSPCRSAPRAMRVTELRAHTELCEHVDCAPPIAPCDPVEDASAYRAVCHDGACDMVRTGTGLGMPGR